MSRSSSFFSILTIAAVLLSSCGTNPQNAFPTAQTVASAGSARGTNIETLARGRKIFTTTCTECHVARPIAAYSVQQWRHNVDIMAPRAHLQPDERAAVESYLVAARESLP